MVGLKNCNHVTSNNFGTFEGATTVSIDGAQEFTLRFRSVSAKRLVRQRREQHRLESCADQHNWIVILQVGDRYGQRYEEDDSSELKVA